MTTSETATVEVLTAEVRVLQVGRRQITLSVYRQLDAIDPDDIEPFGRVNDPSGYDQFRTVRVVGRDPRTGALVRGTIDTGATQFPELIDEWDKLPLIVLAGLR